MTTDNVTTTLSNRDQQVLNLVSTSIIRPQTPLKSKIDMSLPPDQHIPLETVEELVEMERKAILMEEAGHREEALELLDKIIKSEPKYASAYNNRAQMRRLNGDPLSIKAAVADLESAVALAKPRKKTDSLSKMQAQVLRNAYGQLAAIYLQQSKKPELSSRSWEYQLKASDMMVEASNYGEQIAASLAVAINPYAKLCGNMMETMLSQYYIN